MKTGRSGLRFKMTKSNVWPVEARPAAIVEFFNAFVFGPPGPYPAGKAEIDCSGRKLVIHVLIGSSLRIKLPFGESQRRYSLSDYPVISSYLICKVRPSKAPSLYHYA